MKAILTLPALLLPPKAKVRVASPSWKKVNGGIFATRILGVIGTLFVKVSVAVAIVTSIAFIKTLVIAIISNE